MRSEIVSDVVVYDVAVSQRTFSNALQRYVVFATPPNFAPHGAQKSVKKTRTSR